MSNRTSAIVWLIAGLAFGFITLSCAGGGGYTLWYAHDKTKTAEKIYEEEKKELEGDKALRPDRVRELNNRRTKNMDDVNDWRQYRQYALVFALSAIIPLLITARCLFSGIYRLLKKPKKEADDDDDEGEDEEEEKKPSRKGKR